MDFTNKSEILDNAFMIVNNIALIASDDECGLILWTCDLENIKHVASFIYEKRIKTFHMVCCTFPDCKRKYQMLLYVERNKDYIFKNVKKIYISYMRKRNKMIADFKNMYYPKIANKLNIDIKEMKLVAKRCDLNRYIKSCYEYLILYSENELLDDFINHINMHKEIEKELEENK